MAVVRGEGQTDTLHKSAYGGFMSRSSTSKKMSALGGMTPPAPSDPYAKSGGHRSLAFIPLDKWRKPSSQHLMTQPDYKGNTKGWPLS